LELRRVQKIERKVKRISDQAPSHEMVNEFVNRLIDEGIENRTTSTTVNNYKCYNFINFEDF
jgi:hypothetical protein